MDYSYNAESQMTFTGTLSNTWDANGNETRSGYTVGTYNEITNDGTWSYYYDGVGNMVEKIDSSTGVTWNYSYDFDFRVCVATERNSGGTILESGSYVYDVYGDLVAETITTGGSTTISKFAYNGDQIYADMNSAGTITTLYDGGMDVGTFYGRIQSGTVYWIAQNYQGSVVDIINGSGTSTLDAIKYDGAGLILSQTGSQYLGNYAYTGLRFDSPTGYYIAQDRWYNHATGQWLELDPIGVQGGLSNFRSYVGDDWANRTDLSGLDPNPPAQAAPLEQGFPKIVTTKTIDPKTGFPSVVTKTLYADGLSETVTVNTDPTTGDITETRVPSVGYPSTKTTTYQGKTTTVTSVGRDQNGYPTSKKVITYPDGSIKTTIKGTETLRQPTPNVVSTRFTMTINDFKHVYEIIPGNPPQTNLLTSEYEKVTIDPPTNPVPPPKVVPNPTVVRPNNIGPQNIDVLDRNSFPRRKPKSESTKSWWYEQQTTWCYE